MNKSILVICLLLVASVYTYKNRAEMHRMMRQVDKQQKTERRRMQQTTKSRRQESNERQMKIFFDMSSINESLDNEGLSDRKQFYKKVFEVTGKWWEQALKVTDDRSKIMPKIRNYQSNYQRQLGFKFDSHHNPEDYDLLVRVFWCPDDQPALAWAGPFLRHPDSQRPITGTVCCTRFGDNNFKKVGDSVNRAAGTQIHEFGHIIAFISFQQQHSDKVSVDHTLNEYVWTGENVVEKARQYYNCPTIKGVPLQNKNGKVGGHWSEDHLGTELMTPSTGADPEKVSLMTLALCEDTKWYKPDYSFAENYNYNKGRGCGVFAQRCPSPAPCEAGRRGFITSDYKGVGYCNQNSNGCAVERKFSNRDCAKAAGWGSHFDAFGASYGGNCAIVEGEFKNFQGGWITSQNQLSVEANCNPRMTSYTLTFKNFKQNRQGGRIGDVVVRCTEEAEEEFNVASRFPSKVKCHDPAKFCGARFGTELQTCDDSCRKNGRCQHVSPKNRRLQSVTNPCNAAGQPQTPAKFRGNAPATPITNTKKGAQEWMCWCYRDGKRKLACGDLKEDNDGFAE